MKTPGKKNRPRADAPPGQTRHARGPTIGQGRRASHRVRAAIVLAFAVVYVLLLSTLAVRAHLGLQTQMNDMGNADQCFWAATQGDWKMHQSNNLDDTVRPRFAVHANVLFLPLSLLYHLWADPRILLILASVACAAAGTGLFFLARQLLGPSWWTLVPPLAFLASPMVHDANLYDFHIITLATSFLVWCLWAFEAHRFRLGWILFGLLLLCKEDMPLVGFMLGLSFLLVGERRRGLLMMLAGGLYMIVVIGVMLPVVSGELTSKGTSVRYDWLFERPGAILATLTRPDRIRLPLYFLLSGAIAAWRGRHRLLPLIPHLAMGLLAATTWMTRLTGTYYWIMTEAVIVAAVIYAARPRDRKSGPVRWPLAYLGAATLVFSVLFSQVPYGLGSKWDNYSVDDDRHTLQEVARAAGIQSPEVKLAIQNNLGPQLSQRREIASLPRRFALAEAVVLHLRYKGGPASGLFVRGSPRFMFSMHIRQLVSLAERLIRSDQWGLAVQKERFYVFLRDAKDAIPQEAAVARLRKDAAALSKEYGEALRFRSPLARYVVAGLSWDDLLGKGEALPENASGDPAIPWEVLSYSRQAPILDRSDS